MRNTILTTAALVIAALCLAGCAAREDSRPQTTAAATPVAAKTVPAPTLSATPANATAPQQQPTPSDGVRRITIVELRQALEKGDAVVVDVRNETSFRAGHIKGARLIPEAEVGKRAGQLPRGKLIVTYCS